MGFNFGAMLGGAASQIVEDINEKEKDVKLRTRTILDRQVAQTAANQKEYKAQKKKVTEQMNALVGLFGNTPDGIAKARSIVAGGDTHYANMYGKLQTHADEGGDVNELVTLTKGSEDIGFTGVEEATDSIVKLAALPELKMGTGFGANYFKKEQQAMIDAGLIQTMQLSETAKKSYGQTKIDLTKMAKKSKNITEILNDARANLTKAEQSGNKDQIDIATKAYNKALKRNTEESVAFQIKKMEAEADNNTTLRNVSLNYTAGKKEFLGTLYNKKNRVVGDDGEVIRDEAEANAYVRKKTKAYHLKVLDGYLDGNGVFNNPNAEKFVMDNPTLKGLLGEARRIKVGEEETGDTSDVIETKEQKLKKVNETITNIASNNPIGGDSVYQIISAAGVKVRDPIKLEAIIKKAYKDASDIEIAKAVQVALQRIKKEDIENKDIDEAYKRNLDAIRNPKKTKEEIQTQEDKVKYEGSTYEDQKPLKVYRKQLKKMEDETQKGIFG
jgi:hypothetical protein